MEEHERLLAEVIGYLGRAMPHMIQAITAYDKYLEEKIAYEERTAALHDIERRAVEA